MFLQARYLVFSALLLITAYTAHKVYLYYFDETIPHVVIDGFEDDKGYMGDVSGLLKGCSPYKISHISMWIDDAKIHNEFKINRKDFEHPVSIPAKSIADGKHTIKFEIVDGTKHKNSTTIQRTFYTDNVILQATLPSLMCEHKVYQGRCAYIQVQTNKPIKSATVQVFQEKYEMVPENKNSLMYEVHIPVDCEQEPGEYPCTIEVIDRLNSKIILEAKITVVAYPFKRSTFNKANNKLQTELEFTQLQEQDLEEKMLQLAQASPHEKLWTGLFDVPILSKGITTDFGVIRTSQDRGRKIHKALDLVADPKSIVWASNNGVVVLKDRYTNTGNTVVIDHGCGVLSLYCHLHDYANNLQVGQKVKKGHPLGRMGMTGYASGDHLHWEIRVKGVAVEPMQWTQRWN